MITISQLKEIIKDLPDDMPIMVTGYEVGFDECTDIDVEDIFKYNENTSPFGAYSTTNTHNDKTYKGKGLYIL